MSTKKFVCQKGLTVQVFSSYAGFYIGTFIYDGDDVGPNCRCSGYYKTREQAEQALKTRTFDRVCMENNMCHGGCGCQIIEIKDNDKMQLIKEELNCIEKCLDNIIKEVE